MPALTKSPRYREFIHARDLALETILDKYQAGMAKTYFDMKRAIMDAVLASHARGEMQPGPHANHAKASLYNIIAREMALAVNATISQIMRMRASAYILARAGEGEAIARGLGRPLNVSVRRIDVASAQNADALLGGQIADRIKLAFDRLQRELHSAIDYCFIVGPEERPDVVARILRVFPVEHSAPKKRSLKKVPYREAAGDWLPYDPTDNPGTDATLETMDTSLGAGKSLTTGYIDEQTWDQMLDDYKSEYLPADGLGRAPNAVRYDEGQWRPAWEVENETMDDFVKTVRDGQNEEAKKQGIVDMMWIAVIDSHTCETCCIPRDGLTSSQISEKLNSGDIPDDCDAIVPPAHPNCRCALAPVTDELNEDLKSQDVSGFNDWLDE